jgi:hypothetical protein
MWIWNNLLFFSNLSLIWIKIGFFLRIELKAPCWIWQRQERKNALKIILVLNERHLLNFPHFCVYKIAAHSTILQLSNTYFKLAVGLIETNISFKIYTSWAFGKHGIVQPLADAQNIQFFNGVLTFSLFLSLSLSFLFSLPFVHRIKWSVISF